MRLLDLVEQQHAVRMLVDGVGQQAALVVADIARRRADQPADRVALHIFGHVEALQRDAHDRGELARDLGLADAGRAGEQVIADRLVGIAQAGARQLDRRRQLLDRHVLAEDDALQVGLEMLEHALVVGRHRLGRDPRHGRDDRLDFLGRDDLLAARRRHQHLHRADLVDHVDRLVGQFAVVDVARRQFDRALDRVGRVADVVVAFERRAQAGDDLDRVLDRRLVDVDLLEPAQQARGPFRNGCGIPCRWSSRCSGSRPTTSAGLSRLDASIAPPRGRAGADHRVDLVDEQDRVGQLFELGDDRLQPLLEIAAIAGAGEQARPCRASRWPRGLSTSGTSPSMILRARPSAIAVLPTPGSPT